MCPRFTALLRCRVRITRCGCFPRSMARFIWLTAYPTKPCAAGMHGSDLAAVHSGCGLGTQLLVSESGEPGHDTLRAYEIPDRDSVAVSSPLEFDGPITALWPDATLTSAVAIVKRSDTGWYEANRITVSCAN